MPLYPAAIPRPDCRLVTFVIVISFLVTMAVPRPSRPDIGLGLITAQVVDCGVCDFLKERNVYLLSSEEIL